MTMRYTQTHLDAVMALVVASAIAAAIVFGRYIR